MAQKRVPNIKPNNLNQLEITVSRALLAIIDKYGVQIRE